MRFADLDLILEGTAESCNVTAISDTGSSAGQANLSVAQYLATQDLYHSLDAVEAIGRALFQALPEEVRQQISQKPSSDDLRLRLDIRSPELSSLPWEYLHDGRTFLALTPDMVLLRHMAGPDIPAPEGNLRILVAIPAAGDGLEARTAEKARIRKAVGQQSDLQLDFLDEQAGAVTLAAIQRELRRSRTAGAAYHVLHLACPLQDDENRGVALVLEDEQGNPLLAGIDQLKWCAADHPLQFVLFSSAEGSSKVDATASISAAAELAEFCAGAVCVPRFLPTPGVMELFAGEVYLAIADGYPIDAAVTEGRRATLREAGEGTTDWAAPVLFVRGAPISLPKTLSQPTVASLAGTQPVAMTPVGERTGDEPAASKSAAPLKTAEGDQGAWWSQLPLELWIAILGAATTILVALIPVGVAFFKPDPAEQLAEIVAPTPAATPSLVAYDFGALVAYFDVPDDGSVDPAEADLLIDRFYLQLENELAESMDPLRFRAGLLGPDVAGRVSGATADEREQNAAQLARSYGADMVLYGVVSHNDITRQLELQPEYYIAPESFSDALEMTGAFRFGNRIGVSTPLNRGLGVERELSARATSLAQVIVGLSLYLLERDFSGALTAFESAAAQAGWESTEGREVLDILIGNTHLAMAAGAAEQCDQPTVMRHVNEALESYGAAAELAPQYARAYAGQAAAYYLAAQWADERNDGCAEGIVDVQTLEQMFQSIDLANSASEQPKEIGVRSRILLTEAQAHFLDWLIADTPSVDTGSPDQLPFWPATEMILNNYENGDQPSVASVASYTRVLRGQTLALLGDCWGAEDEYDGALAIAETDPTRRMEIWEQKGFCYEQLNQPTAASEAYNQALQIARELGDSEAVTYFETARRLQSESSEP